MEDNMTDLGKANLSTTIYLKGLMSVIVHSHWRNYTPLPQSAHLLMGSMVSLMVLFAGVANLWVIGLFIRYRSLRISSNLLVLNLAITDTFLALGNLPWLAISSFKGFWTFGYIGCQVYGFVGAMAGFISINTLTMIAIERFFVIVIREPYRHIRTSNRTVLVAIVFIWVYSFMWAICPLIGWGSFILEGSMTSCTFDFFSRDVNTKSYVASILVFCFTVQLFLIICSYVRIYLKVLQHEKEIVNCYVDGNLKIQNRKVKKFHSVHVKTAKISLVIISIFCLSWTPYAVIAIIGNFGDASVITPLASTIPGVFAKLSTVLNPMIYALLHPKFRNKLPFQKKKVLKTKINFQALMKLDNESPLQTSSSMSAPFDAATPIDYQKETMV
ncbi:rhodopsin-like isoform X1 [Crassostrea virginica]|uniref:Rhodopsin-like isoform X1 n=1 Tax=Crassostrea virginica TaxID=6565 RepID=A0A8B8CR83_CRAVI|nr:rhodopsin-like isoform X1 [Crassostrea virginica]